MDAHQRRDGREPVQLEMFGRRLDARTGGDLDPWLAQEAEAQRRAALERAHQLRLASARATYLPGVCRCGHSAGFHVRPKGCTLCDCGRFRQSGR